MSKRNNLVSGPFVPRIYQLTTAPSEGFTVYCSSKLKTHQLALSLSRILPPSHRVIITTVEFPDVQGEHHHRFSTYPLDMSKFDRRHKNVQYHGPITEGDPPFYEEHTGRGHLFTPNEKAKTYHHIVSKFRRDEWHEFAPLTDMVMLRRIDIPLGRWMQAERTAAKREKKKQRRAI